jgi:transcriptional regulator with XRE-family HTH domain
MYFKSLDTEIAAYLRKEHMTQEELAKKLGMAPNTFSWKRRGVDGKEFSVAEVRRVAEEIGLSTFDGILADYAKALQAPTTA